MNTVTRRAFVRWAGRVVLAVSAALPGTVPAATPATTQATGPQPNILLIFAEDLSPTQGCYGDPVAHTPNLDKLATEGQRFTRAFSVAPVCSPSRSSIITGQYPTAISTHNHRSRLIGPRPRLFTEDLQAAGYQAFWPGKTDFNFAVPKGTFDNTQPLLDRDGRLTDRLPRDKPFIAYTNLMITHEGQTFLDPAALRDKTPAVTDALRCDPAKVTLPPYYPDDPRVRRTVANYYDQQTQMDANVGRILKAVDDAGLRQKTVVIFLGDHGWGLPRGKRWLYDSGTHVPLIVRWPDGRHAGETVGDLVSLLDLAPSLQAWARLTPVDRLQGRVTIGPGATEATRRQFVNFTRDRMDEAPDRIRGVRDTRFKYIRNDLPTIPYAQPNRYMDRSPAMQAWRELAAANKLTTDAQRAFFAPTKPTEELYDCDADPHELHNLAADPAHAADLQRLRAELDAWSKRYDTFGQTAESELTRRVISGPAVAAKNAAADD